MDGPQNTAGLKVLVHSPTDVPRIGDLGFNVPVGMQALIGLEKRKVACLHTRVVVFLSSRHAANVGV